MTLRPRPSDGCERSRVNSHNRRARSAITLGAAFALLCAVVFGVETPNGYAASGLFDALFGGSGGSGRHTVSPLPYNGYAPGAGYDGRRHYGHHRHSSRHAVRAHRARYAHARRHLSERRPVAAIDRRVVARPEKRPSSVEKASFAEMSARQSAAPQTLSRRSVCVRACDGYFFPIANLKNTSEITTHQAACDRLCPGAKTQLFVMAAGSDKIEDATPARGGDAYSQLVARVDPAEAKAKSCSCQSVAGDLLETAAFLRDVTLRPGDTVVTPQGVRVVRRGSHYPFKKTDFLSLAETRDMPQSTRGALFAIERAIKTPHGRRRDWRS